MLPNDIDPHLLNRVVLMVENLTENYKSLSDKVTTMEARVFQKLETMSEKMDTKINSALKELTSITIKELQQKQEALMKEQIELRSAMAPLKDSDKSTKAMIFEILKYCVIGILAYYFGGKK